MEMQRPRAGERWDRRPCPWVTGSYEGERKGSGDRRGVWVWGRGGCRKNPGAAVLRQAPDGKKGQLRAPDSFVLCGGARCKRNTIMGGMSSKRRGLGAVRPTPSESPRRAESAIPSRNTRC